MKALELKHQMKNFSSGIFIAMMICSLASCSTKAMFLTSSVVPAARGSVKVKTDKNKNYVIQMQISNLAEVERLQPAKKTYVVWMQTDGNITKNIGRVNSTRKLKVSFKTVTSYKPIKIFITAEDNESAEYPDEKIVLTTENFWKD
jgi:hypothetical protein